MSAAASSAFGLSNLFCESQVTMPSDRVMPTRLAVRRLGRPLAGRLADAHAHAIRLFSVDAGQQQHELVAAVAGHDVRVPQSVAQQLGDGLQDRVPGLVAEAVIDLLELVEVHEDHGQWPGVFRRRLELPGQ